MQWEEIKKLLELMKENELSELEFENDHFRVAFKSGRYVATPAVVTAAPVAAMASASSEATASSGDSNRKKHSARAKSINSPFVGTFYRAASPDSDPFTQVGQHVKKGQTLCIIEAMKLMNEIEAETSGTVVEILPQNGRAVQFGETLFVIEPD